MIGNIWPFRRDKQVSDGPFKANGCVAYQYCSGGNNVLDQPWRIMSTRAYVWPHGV